MADGGEDHVRGIALAQLNPFAQAVIEACRFTGIAVEIATLARQPETDLTAQWLAPPELDIVEVGIDGDWLGWRF